MSTVSCLGQILPCVLGSPRWNGSKLPEPRVGPWDTLVSLCSLTTVSIGASEVRGGWEGVIGHRISATASGAPPQRNHSEWAQNCWATSLVCARPIYDKSPRGRPGWEDWLCIHSRAWRQAVHPSCSDQGFNSLEPPCFIIFLNPRLLPFQVWRSCGFRNARVLQRLISSGISVFFNLVKNHFYMSYRELILFFFLPQLRWTDLEKTGQLTQTSNPFEKLWSIAKYINPNS